MPKNLIRRVQGTLAIVRDFSAYGHANSRFQDAADEYLFLFDKFLTGSVGHRAIRIEFNTDEAPHIGLDWETCGLHETPFSGKQNAHKAISDLPDEFFYSVLCTGIERIPQPMKLIHEIWRIMVPSGQIWVEVPFNSPHTHHEGDYWRMSPHGLRFLMQDFDEIFSAAYLPGGSFLCNSSFYFGLKPTDSNQESAESKSLFREIDYFNESPFI
ncbi:MAG: hypothetical protein WCB90_08665 [Methanosarcina sp.]